MSVVVRRVAAVAAATVLTATACQAEGDGDAVAPLAQIAADVNSEPAENGINSVPPDKALATAIAAMEDTGSYRVSGTTLAGATIDIAFKVGEGSTGTVTSASTVSLVSTGGTIYVTGDPATISAQVGADVAETIAGKWLLIPPDSAAGFALFADGETFATSVLGSQAPGEVTGVTEVDGVPAVGLLFPDTGGTLWVAATGEPLPLRFEEKGATAASGVLKFSEFGGEVAIALPEADAVVDLTKVGG